MTHPEDPRASGPLHPDADPVDDPTGVHALLSSLPEPGPMPPDLVERINQSLRQEAGERAPASERVSYALFAGRNGRTGSTPWLRVAAVAAIALVLGGGMLAGTGAFGTNLLTVLGAPPAKSATPTTPAGAGSTGDGTASPGATEQRADPRRGPQTFVSSGRRYVSETLRHQAATVLATPPTPLHELAAEAPHLGPIATPTGLAACLTALDLPGDAEALVDLATYQGQPAAVIVTRYPTHDEVRVVKRNCSTAGAELVAGPYPL